MESRLPIIVVLMILALWLIRRGLLWDKRTTGRSDARAEPGERPAMRDRATGDGLPAALDTHDADDEELLRLRATLLQQREDLADARRQASAVTSDFHALRERLAFEELQSGSIHVARDRRPRDRVDALGASADGDEPLLTAHRTIARTERIDRLSRTLSVLERVARSEAGDGIELRRLRSEVESLRHERSPADGAIASLEARISEELETIRERRGSTRTAHPASIEAPDA